MLAPMDFLSIKSLVACLCLLVDGSAASGTTPFVLDGNRMYAELSFVRPNGSIHRALAFVDMGSPSMEISESLFRELKVDRRKGLRFKLGGLSIDVPASQIDGERTHPHSVGSKLQVEALLPASVLQHYQVVIDYKSRTLTLATSGTAKPTGSPVPFHLKKETGLIAVDASIDGKTYAVTIDNGSAYTWLTQSAVREWLRRHPEWERGVGAVGASNMMMSGDTTEMFGILVRIPEIVIGQMSLTEVGALGASSGGGPSTNQSLFDWYSTKNALPVIGWIGANVLKDYRLTIDYTNRVMYWLKEAEPDSADLDQVGLTLRSEDGAYVVASVATKKGAPTVRGVWPGDVLVRIGDMETKSASWGDVYAALHGEPGETRRLVLERDGRQYTVDAKVTAF